MAVPIQPCLWEVLSTDPSAFSKLEAQTTGQQSTEAPGTQLFSEDNGPSAQGGSHTATFFCCNLKLNGPSSKILILITVVFKHVLAPENADCYGSYTLKEYCCQNDV